MFKYDQVTNILMEEISHMPPDSRLLSRTQLCSKFGVTRTTVDKAIAALTAKGYLQSIKGSGTFITPQSKISVINENTGSLIWGVIMPDVMYGVYTAILRGVADIANENNISVVIFNTDNDDKRQHEYVKKLLESGVNGVILVPAITDKFMPETYTLLKEKNIPFVFCNRNVESMPEIPFVSSNNFYGAYIGTKHLIANGYNRIGFISKKRYSSMLDRYYGYAAAMLEQELPILSRFVVIQYDNNDGTGDYQITHEMFDCDDHPDGVFCACEEMVPNLYHALDDLHLKISDDIGIISYDSSNLCETLNPRLTAVSFQGYQAGHQSALILRDMMFGNPRSDTNIFILQPSIDVRQSCIGKMNVNNEKNREFNNREISQSQV